MGDRVTIDRPCHGCADEGRTVDFDELLSWLWLCCIERFQFREPGFAKRCIDWLGDVPQLAPQVAPPVEAPEPVAKSPPKKKGKGS